MNVIQDHLFGTIFEIDIHKEDYLRCENFSQKMWANSKKGNYGSGLMNTPADPYKVTRTGCLGEMAFHKYTGLEYNFNYIKGGDKFDFNFQNISFDIKTVTRKRAPIGYIYGKNANGKRIPVTKNIYVFCSVAVDDIKMKCAKIWILGYQTSQDIESLGLIESPRGYHKNYEVNLYKLRKFASREKWLNY